MKALGTTKSPLPDAPLCTPPDGFEPSTDCLEGRKVASRGSAFPSHIKGLSCWGVLGEDRNGVKVDKDLAGLSTFVSRDRLPRKRYVSGECFQQLHLTNDPRHADDHGAAAGAAPGAA